MSEATPVSSLPWLNNEFLGKVLKSVEKDDDIKVTSFEVARATAAGDNYASDMYRVKIQYIRNGEPETKSIVVKSETSKVEIAKTMEKSNAFERESATMSAIVPKIQNILQESCGDTYKLQPFAAKCLYSHLIPPVKLIVLEDLKVAGFRMAERTEGLDIDHCRLVLRTLARYHASSAVLYEKNPEVFEAVRENVYNEKMRDDLDGFFRHCVLNIANDVKKWPEIDARYCKSLQSIPDITTEYVMKSFQKQDGDFNVLTHGDLWLNNMMFRYSESTGQVEDVRFVDYQFGNLTNAALDILYFLHTSPSPEVMDKHDILIEEYHRSLEETFTLLGHKHLHPTIEQLEKELDKKGLYAVIVACSVLPVVLVERSEIPDMDKVVKQEEGVKFSKRFKQTFLKLLPIFEKKGWLDVEKYV